MLYDTVIRKSVSMLFTGSASQSSSARPMLLMTMIVTALEAPKTLPKRSSTAVVATFSLTSEEKDCA